MPVADTSFVIDLMRRDQGAISLYEEYEQRGIALQTTGITALELYKGAFISGTAQNRLNVAALLELFTVLPIDETIYEAFGRISSALALRGDAIGDFDEVIATMALMNDGEIITRDRHFSKIPHLKIISY
ncbi:MAG: type II toxin-antitoxin system VapC family toxin [Methanoregulaceae archaeon]|jgi:predicted nucleic acid-binding protein|nr:MAG: type II toxin-antitoxin system VapC family toxin [Methanoregulaceae archaeon]RPI37413.1 MAG: type II toxin-antitoxin system VapC family toxin [Methanoregulaceae archaeon]